jgi:STE24 endopeptidase
MSIYQRVAADPADWFSPDEVRKAKDYQRPAMVVRVVSGLLTLGVFLVIIWTGAAAAVADWAGAQAWYTRLPVVLLFLLGVNTIVDLPFEVWMEFGHERKWEFSTQTPGRFVGDAVKGFVLNVVLAGLLMYALWSMIVRSPEWWWVFGWLVFFLFSVVLVFLAPVLIMPLFNKFTPLEDQETAQRLRALAQAAGLSISDVEVMDASKRTRKDNAFFAGLGKSRKVVLFDNILEQPAASIDNVVAHELGHWKHRHIVRLMTLGSITSFAVFLFVFVVSRWDAAIEALDVESVADPAAMPLVLLALVGGQAVLRYLSAWHSRALERQADLAALGLTKDPDGFTSMMQLLATKNLSELAPSRLAYLRLDHPPPAERLEMAKLWKPDATPQTAGAS